MCFEPRLLITLFCFLSNISMSLNVALQTFRDTTRSAAAFSACTLQRVLCITASVLLTTNRKPCSGLGASCGLAPLLSSSLLVHTVPLLSLPLLLSLQIWLEIWCFCLPCDPFKSALPVSSSFGWKEPPPRIYSWVSQVQTLGSVWERCGRILDECCICCICWILHSYCFDGQCPRFMVENFRTLELICCLSSWVLGFAS